MMIEKPSSVLTRPLDGSATSLHDPTYKTSKHPSSGEGSVGSTRDESAQGALSRLADLAQPIFVQRLWRNRLLARVRHHATGMRRLSNLLTRMHATIIQLSGGRIRRSFLFTGGMPVLVITTTGRKSGQPRPTPLGYLTYGDAFAVLASNAGSDRTPAWWLNLQANSRAEILVDGARHLVRARQADETEDDVLWRTFARLNPGFDEYRNLTARRIPVVILDPWESPPNGLGDR